MMNDYLPIVIDIEASGFGSAGYPIEIGFIDEQRKAHCFLVDPQPGWIYWDSEAEALHGISRQNLLDHGKSAVDIAHYMNNTLRGKKVYTDAWSFDMSWLGNMFDAVDREQMFRLKPLQELLSEGQREKWSETRDQVVRENCLKRHRASSDAWIIQETYTRIVSGA